MVRLAVCSLADEASVNIRDALLNEGGWSEDGDFQGRPAMRRGDLLLVSIDGLHIHAEEIDLAVEAGTGHRVDEVVFLSRHRAASGTPTLTVHPIGNWGRAEFGGRDETLVPPAPHLMTSLLRAVKSAAVGLPYEVAFEVTHHGPFISRPAVFLEIGSSEANWSDRAAAAVLARSLLGTEVQSHPVAVGIGGGHYAPRFTEVALSRKVSFAHMLPGYAMDLADPAGLGRRIASALEVSGARIAYVHRKAMKRSEATIVSGLVRELGAEVVDSSDLEAL